MAFNIQNNYGDNYEVQAGATVVAGGIEAALKRKETIDRLKKEACESGVSFTELMKKHKGGVVDVEILDEANEEAADPGDLTTTNLFTDPRGIGEPGDLWLLMVAAEARKVQFDNLPKFVEWAFEMFNVPFDKDECISKLQARMRNQPWSVIRNQQEMIGFIKQFRSYNNIREADTKKANAIYVALRGI